MSSSSCSVCGSKQTNIIDGLMYCDICGTQVFDYRELEADEDQLVIVRSKIPKKKIATQSSIPEENLETAEPDLSTTNVRKRRKGEILEKYVKFSASTDSIECDEIFCSKDNTTGRVYAPTYLKNVGVRISAFTKILAKGVGAIRRETAIPSSFPDQVFSIYQRYLSACNVAYTSSDYTEDVEEMFRAVVLNKNLAHEHAQEKKKKRERRKEQGKEALEKSETAWELLMSDTLGEKLDIQSDGEYYEEFDSEMASNTRSREESRLVQVIDTMVPKEVINHATSLYLALDVLVALLFISLVTVGCRWILLSDIIRWAREGRFGISVFELAALDSRLLKKPERSDRSFWKKMDIPLYEFHRTVLFIWQICRLPSTPAKVDFEQIVARMLHHLNLPRAMMERVLVLIERTPPCIELSEKDIRRQGSIENGCFVNGFFLNNGRSFSASQMVTVFGRPKQCENSLNTDIFFSTETKAFAYILMALKLCFGLDGVREYGFDGNTDSFFNNTFNIMQWLYQLKMRIMFWEGYDPLDILQTYGRYEKSTEDNIAYRVRYSSREYGFTHCIPSSMRIDSSASIPNPFPEYTCGVHNYGSNDEALYVPLRRQENVLRIFLARELTAEEKEEIRTSIDEIALKTFRADFEKHTIAEPSSSSACNPNLTQNKHGTNTNHNQKWYTYFPCAKEYVRYPRPNFTNGGILHMKETNRFMFYCNKRMGLGATTSGLRMLFASRKAAIDAWECAQSEMSQTFSLLIHWFSKIIGESEIILYCAFMMLEFQIVDFVRFEELKRTMVEGRTHPLKIMIAHVNGRRSFKTLYVSAAEDVSDASEVDIVRIGLPRDRGICSDESSILDDSIERDDYWSNTSSEIDSTPPDSSIDERSEERPSCASSKKRSASPGVNSSAIIREVANVQHHFSRKMVPESR